MRLIATVLDGYTDENVGLLSKSEQARVLVLAKAITEIGWLPIVVMIDKDLAEKNAAEHGIVIL